jgi:SET domain-containing protein
VSDVIVKKSKIEGLGVFASRNFKKGEVVIKWDISHQLTSKEVKKLSESEKRYVAFLDGKYILMQSPAKYTNHLCDANIYVDNFCYVAKRDIKKGEEVGEDYSEDETPGFKMKCNCGNKNCRKIITRHS